MDGVSSNENDEFDKQVDYEVIEISTGWTKVQWSPPLTSSTESSSQPRSDHQPRENSRNTLRVVPTPLRGSKSSNSDTRTENGGDDRVGSGNGPAEAGGDGQPEG